MGRALQRYKKLFDEVKRGRPKRIYFLYGPEEFLRKEFIAELVKAALGEKNRAFNLDIFHGDDFDRDAFSDRVSSFPLFTDRRMVILKKFEALSVANQDAVLERLGNLSESVVVVIEASGAKLETARLKRLGEIADSEGLSFCFQPLSDDEAVDRARARIEREGFRIEPDALSLLVDSVGTRLIDLANEVEKIVLSSDPGATVTRENVAAVVGKYRTENLFAFIDRLGRDDAAATVSRLNRIIDGGEEPVFVLSMLIRRVTQLLHVRLLADEGESSARAVSDKLAGLVSPFQISILVDQARRFDTRGLGVYLDNLNWADRLIKSSSVAPGHLIEVALVASAERRTLETRAV